MARHIAVLAAAVQFLVVHGIAFGLVSGPLAGRDVRIIDRSGRATRILEMVVSQTCHDPGPETYAVNHRHRRRAESGDWLAPAPAGLRSRSRS